MKLHHSRALAAVALTVALAVPLAAQSQAEGKARPLTAEQGEAILKELRELRQLLERLLKDSSGRAAPAFPGSASVRLQLGDGPVLGSPQAPLTMVEFTDYQCFFCRRFYVESFSELKKNFIDTGKLRYVVRDFPLNMHADASRAAEAAHCAAAQGQYWPMRHALMSNQNALNQEALLRYAQDLSLDMDRFRPCLEADRYAAEIQQSQLDASIIGISGTPSFVLGVTTPEGVEGFRIDGAIHYPELETRIKRLLASVP